MYYDVFQLSIKPAIIVIETKTLHGLCLGQIHELILFRLGKRSDGKVDVDCFEKA